MEVTDAAILWETIAVHHFGTRVLKCISTIIVNVLAVDWNLKPAYLWDAFLSAASNVRHFIDDLKEKCLLRNNLHVLVVGDDVFVLSVVQTMSHLHDLVATKILPLVDVSKTLISPILLDGGVMQQVKNDILVVLMQLNVNDTDDFLSHSSYIRHTELLKLELGPHWNITTLFGALLHYPVIYWYAPNLDNGNESCLAMSPLCVFNISVNVLQTSGHRDLGCRSLHSIYSFSIPECFKDHFKEPIAKWYADLQTAFELQNVFTDMNLKVHTVTLPSVAL